jgi:tRNA uridine 5-carboxymethylaminomethyl modification enzyme
VLESKGLPPIDKPVRLEQLLRRPEINSETINAMYGNELCIGNQIAMRVEAEVKYEGYIHKQQAQIRKLCRFEKQPIPGTFNYAELKGFSSEAREKLLHIQPKTVGQAMRISGVTPADVSVLLVHLHREGGHGSGGDRSGLGRCAGGGLS